jgi:hypothetical protein
MLYQNIIKPCVVNVFQPINLTYLRANGSKSFLIVSDVVYLERDNFSIGLLRNNVDVMLWVGWFEKSRKDFWIDRLKEADSIFVFESYMPRDKHNYLHYVCTLNSYEELVKL